ncbi:hypothetical protein MKX03_005525 [Papaver bracteatum]|nr:hypothetical protein MKX03_005525 [Papaver bracteatum]
MAGLVVMSSLSSKRITPCQERVAGSILGLPSVVIVRTDGGMNFRDGIDASGRKPTGKGGYQYSDKYGGNVDGYSLINPNPNPFEPVVCGYIKSFLNHNSIDVRNF